MIHMPCMEIYRTYRVVWKSGKVVTLAILPKVSNIEPGHESITLVQSANQTSRLIDLKWKNGGLDYLDTI